MTNLPTGFAEKAEALLKDIRAEYKIATDQKYKDALVKARNGLEELIWPTA